MKQIHNSGQCYLNRPGMLKVASAAKGLYAGSGSSI